MAAEPVVAGAAEVEVAPDAAAEPATPNGLTERHSRPAMNRRLFGRAGSLLPGDVTHPPGEGMVGPNCRFSALCAIIYTTMEERND